LSQRRIGCRDTFQPAQTPIDIWLQAPDVSLNDALDGLMSVLPRFAISVSAPQQDPYFIPRPP
jgi:hypothetical protein